MNIAPFPTTRRSVVLALSSTNVAERERAFDTLVACYWKPLYKYCRVAWQKSREDAEDLTQSFFARALEKESLASYDPSKAAFRTFLRLLFERHLSNEWKASQRTKRGGGGTHLDFAEAEAEVALEGPRQETPEDYFQRQWARSVFATALAELRACCEAEGKETQFAIFEHYDIEGGQRMSYRELAARFGIAETQVTNHLSAMRRRFRETVLETLRSLTASEEEYRSEVRALLGGRS